MKPSKNDVFEMVAALMTVVAGIRRGSQRGDAASLAVLGAIAARVRARPLDVARNLAVNQSTVTRQIQKLEGLGFVKLSIDPRDRRSFSITLTRAGHNETRRLVDIGLSRFATFVHDWPAAEVRTLTRLLVKLEKSKSAAPRPFSSRNWQKRK